MATSGRTIISIPNQPSPALNQRKNMIFMDRQKMEPPNSLVSKLAEATLRFVLTRALFWAQGSAATTRASGCESGSAGWRSPKCHRCRGVF